MLDYFKRVCEAWIDYPERMGRHIGDRYETVRFLGMGSFGLAYVCRDKLTGEQVVLKHPKPSKGMVGRELLNREADMLLRLQHPRIPSLRDRFEHKKQMYLVTDYIEGYTVEDLIFEKNTVFSEQECLRFTARLMEIVGHIHKKGIVHLDIRIPNVIVKEEEIYLIDFGMAREIGEPDAVAGSADEETRLRRTASAASDLYAIGHFMLYMLYSSFKNPSDRPPVDWQDELSVSAGIKGMIRRLLQIDMPYERSELFIGDLRMYV